MLPSLLFSTLSLLPQAPASQPASRPAGRSRGALGTRTLPADFGEDAPGRAVLPVKFRPIRGAPYASAAEVERKGRVAGDDLVIGLAVGGEAYAWPINMLGGPQREIINEEIAGQPFAVNW